MKKLIRCANQYIWESDWKTIGLLKFCLLSLGICVGMAVPEEKKKTVLRAAFLSFVISYIPLMDQFIRIYGLMRATGRLPRSMQQRVPVQHLQINAAEKDLQQCGGRRGQTDFK